MTQTLKASEPNAGLTPTSLFKCLADETRARMMLLITRDTELCVCELTSALAESQPKISRHLALLRNCGVLADERRGQWVYYRLSPELPCWARDMLHLVLQANQGWLEVNSLRLEQMRDRPDQAGVCAIRGC